MDNYLRIYYVKTIDGNSELSVQEFGSLSSALSAVAQGGGYIVKPVQVKEKKSGE